MKNRTTLLLILGLLLAKISSAQTAGGSAFLDEELYSAFGSVIRITGYPAQDSAWPGYRLMDANGIMRTLSDVTGPAAPGESYSTSSLLMWSGMLPESKNFRIQTRFADFGGTCDLNNPDNRRSHDVVDPPSNYGNTPSSATYQSGPYSSCGGNTHFSQNTFAPVPLVTRAAWMYRACRRIGAQATTAQIVQMALRLRVPDPTPTPVGSNTNVSLESSNQVISDGRGDPATYNWCNLVPTPGENDYQSMFRAFYPGRNIPQIIDPSRSQTTTPTGVSSRRTSLSPTALVFTLNLPPVHAQGVLPLGGLNQAPQFREHLMALVAQSNAHIDTLPSTGPLRWQVFEDRCIPGPSGPLPTKEQVKAAAAWRAMLITMCMDPGWQVL